jgi:hypothetical protein
MNGALCVVDTEAAAATHDVVGRHVLGAQRAQRRVTNGVGG